MKKMSCKLFISIFKHRKWGILKSDPTDCFTAIYIKEIEGEETERCKMYVVVASEEEEWPTIHS